MRIREALQMAAVLLGCREVNLAKPDQQPRSAWKKLSARLAVAFVLVAALCALFHRPVILALIRTIAPRVAAMNHLRLEFAVEGNPLSGLSFTDVRITPVGRTPVNQIRIGSLRAAYSFGNLLRLGSGGFFKNLAAADVTIEVTDLRDEIRHDFSMGMHQILEIPALLPESVDVRNVNVVTHFHDGDFVLRDGNLFLDPNKNGYARVTRLQIPNQEAWKNLDAAATLKNDVLVLRGPSLAEDTVVENLTWDASHFADGRIDASLHGSLFGGTLAMELQNQKNGAHFNTSLRVTAENAALQGLGRVVKSPAPLGGRIAHFDAHVTGDLNTPNSWTGSAQTTIDEPAFGALKAASGTAKLTLENGAVKLDPVELLSRENHALANARGQMPARIEEIPNTALDGSFDINTPDISLLHPALLQGAATAQGNFRLRKRKFSGGITANATEIGSEKFDASQIDISLDVTIPPANDKAQSAFSDELAGHLTAQIQDVRVGHFAFDSARVAAEYKDGWLHLKPLALLRGENTASLRGTLHLPRDFLKIAGTDFNLGFAISAPDAAGFSAESDLTGFKGAIQSSGHLARRDGIFDGQINADCKNLSFGDFNTESLNLAVSVENSVADIHSLALRLNAKNEIAGAGKIGLRAPFDYSGKLHADIPDLAIFTPVLEALGNPKRVAGALTFDWDGGGNVAEMRHSGTVQLKLSEGKYGALQPLAAEIAGKYSPESANIPVLHVVAGKTDTKAHLTLHDTELAVSDILVLQAGVKVLGGGLTMPLDLRTPANRASLIPKDGKIFANLVSEEFDLDALPGMVKQQSPLKGAVKFSLNADGTASNLNANILVRGRNLQAKATPLLAPASLELNCDLKANQLSLNGTLQQPAISPVQIRGVLPFSPLEFFKDGKIDANSPVELSVKMPRTAAPVFAQIAPGIRYIEGAMEIDVRAGGTFARPDFSGAAYFDFPAVRMSDPATPSLNGFRAGLEFVNNDLIVRNFGGELSGGPFNIAGKMHFEKLDAAELDLRLTSQGALLIRNETLTVRADSDIKIAGPFTAAKVTGAIGLTKCSFFRDIDLLPIDLPGRPAPKPSSEIRPGFSLKPPFAGWTFDVAIRSDDPFLIRGNLASGAATADLKLVGTGFAPSLTGSVHLDKFTASLPFSRLTVDHGYLYFSDENPFVPTLDIQGVSSLRDYNIRVYISGTPEKPVTLFMSDPPLPQEQIIALLGTGATAEELTDKSGVLVGRAAMLVFQKFYRKILKQKPSETETFLNRFDLDPSTVDPRTGRQGVSARFKINDNFYITGDADTEGGFRGQLKYLRRYR